MFKNYIFVMVLFVAGWYPAYLAARPPLRRLMGDRYVAGYAITIAAGFFAPNIWLYHLVVIAAFLATTVDREDAICRYVVMIALIPAVTTVLIFGGSFFAGTFQPTLPLTLAMLIASFAKPSRDRTRAVPGWRAEDLAVAALFLILTVGGSRFTPVSGLLRQMGMTALDLVLPYYLLRRNLRSPETLHLMIGCIAISATSLAVIAVYEAHFGWPLFDGIRSRLSMVYGLAAATIRRGNSLRAMASFGAPLLLAYYLMLAMLAWLCSRDLFRNMTIWKGGIVVIALGLLAPQSRGALLAIVPGMIVLLLCRRKFAAAAALLGGAGLGGVAVFALQHMSSALQAFVGGHQEGQFYDYRGLLMHRGMQEGMKHPIFGQSFERVTASLVDITQGEHIVDFVNSYLTFFLISGIVGLAAFVLPALQSLRNLIARARRSELLAAVRSNRAFVLAGLVATYVYIYSMSFIDRMALYPVLLLAMARLTSTQLFRRAPAAKADAGTVQAQVHADEQRFPERLVPA